MKPKTQILDRLYKIISSVKHEDKAIALHHVTMVKPLIKGWVENNEE